MPLLIVCLLHRISICELQRLLLTSCRCRASFIMESEHKKDPENGTGLHPTISSTSHQAGSVHEMTVLGYTPELTRNRSMLTLLFQSLAIAAIPYGEGSPLLSAIYGGGPLSIFLGWIIVCILDECVAISLAELASRYPTSGGPGYWTFQVAKRGKVVLVSSPDGCG